MENSSVADPLLHQSVDRFILFPIAYRKLYKLYKKATSSIWSEAEIDLSVDREQYKQLTSDEQRYISCVLAFFATSDGIVNENLALRFYSDVQVAEARLFYGFQIAIEGVHAVTYSLLIDTLISDPAEKHRLFHAIESIPAVKKRLSGL